MALNSICLVGNLTKDPELKETPNGKSVLNFTVAVDERGSKEHTNFIPVTCWGKLAELVAEYQTKGNKVAVTGRLYQDSWENEEGEKRSAIKVIAENVDFLTPKKDKEEEKRGEVDPE